ncbi:hypothetical protein DS885_17100 [Psychromonas sp. B3M02]|uniref:hypothetical protein n=1 Tax=Psychromonas sp. B3M02 TaxID=2267226 RepID=UPI000DEBFFA1|nr:hypothetical protein [Psychromonas sp. B3M02]RBW41396.1 hypothetical protein DS885_17100 [Psychromonas sp. B3M02]
MLDAICILSKDHQPTREYQAVQGEAKAQTIFSIYEFKLLPAEQIEQYRHSLFCPECLQVAYFRRASKDGKQACFGSRNHLEGCSELNTHKRNVPMALVEKTMLVEQDTEAQLIAKGGNPSSITENKAPVIVSQQKAEVDEQQGFTIDFSVKRTVRRDASTQNKKAEDSQAPISDKPQSEAAVLEPLQKTEKTVTQRLSTLLKSLFKNSSLATSDVWVQTSEQHRWRAKNLFVHFSDAEQLEKVAPRMYWGRISYSDKQLLWLNVADNKNLSIPISHFKEELLARYGITQAEDLKGAKIIIFAKCLNNKQKSRQFLTLWDNDLQYLHLDLAIHSTSKQ